jgi:hypothetical protein
LRQDVTDENAARMGKEMGKRIEAFMKKHEWAFLMIEDFEVEAGLLAYEKRKKGYKLHELI